MGDFQKLGWQEPGRAVTAFSQPDLQENTTPV